MGEPSIAKFVVWSGEFLKKIDLSEVSFEDVVWEVRDGFVSCTYDENGKIIWATEYYKQFGVDRITLSGTNAIIDFHKSYAYKIGQHWSPPLNDKDGHCIYINYCDFSGTDLSNNKIDLSNNTIYEGAIVSNSNFDNTGIKISNKRGENYPDHGLDTEPYLYFARCSLVNCDLTECVVPADQLAPLNLADRGDYYGDVAFAECNLCNTGAKIEMPIPDERCKEMLKKYWAKMEKYGIKQPYELYEYVYKSGGSKALYDEIERMKFYELGLTKRLESVLEIKDSYNAFYALSDKLREAGLKEECKEIDDFLDGDPIITGIASFNRALENGLIYGCYVNGIRILTPEEKELKRIELAQKYGRNESNPDLNAVDDAIQAVRKR